MPGGGTESLFQRLGGRPQVVAHRGASATQAEHTLGAYLKALEWGAEGLECDVRLTADGHLVCVHDRSLRRTGEARGVVSSMALADLEQHDFSVWKNPWADLDDEAPDIDPEHKKVLTLRRLLATVADYERPIELAIETKHPTRYAGLVEKRLVQLLAEFGWTGADSPVRVMSFSWVALRRLRRQAPDLRLVQLIRTTTEWGRVRPFVDSDWYVGPGIALVRSNPELVGRIARRTEVHVWTVNTEADAHLCRDLGVSAFMTDYPGEALRWLGVTPPEPVGG